jgi:NAD(P)-dependent dehydrogenase (short-subunit alcohol dehydrogenase family)
VPIRQQHAVKRFGTPRVSAVELRGRRAVVTGGGGGLGEALVGVLAAEGMRVLVADVDGEAAARVAREVDGEAVIADLAGDEGVEAVVAAAAGDVDVLVNCAGGWSPHGRQYPDAPAGEWDGVLALNLRSPMRLVQALQDPLSRSPVGAVVSISSSAGRGTGAYESPEYAAAKAGLIRFTTSVADWEQRFRIRVSCVVPGWIGLPRALDEVAAMPAGARPALIPPGQVAGEVLALVKDTGSAGRVVVIDEGEPARALDAL